MTTHTSTTNVQAENKFKCPCHGSQYDATGKKIRGPAPLVSCAVVVFGDGWLVAAAVSAWVPWVP